MIKRILLMTAAGMLILSAAYPLGSREVKPDQEERVLIYAYDSFASDWGPGPEIAAEFEARYGIKAEIISVGDAGQVLHRAILEKGNPRADILIGIDNNLLSRALDAGILGSYKPEKYDLIPEHLRLDADYRLIPFDFGYFSILHDTAALPDPPKSLEELTDKRYEKSLILMDPRTSSPGMGFLLWTIARYGDSFTDYWERLKPSILTITDGWSSGYGLFTAGEAPLVLSYTTSPAYHVEFEESTRYQAAIFPEGHYIQIEGAGITKNGPNPEGAEKFMDFLISETAQKILPLTNWMYPVNPAVVLPESYQFAPVPDKTFSIDTDSLSSNSESWIFQWIEVMGR